MTALVIYDSVFGNTEKIALAIGDALRAKEAVSVLKVEQATVDDMMEAALLVVGSPTRAFQPTPEIKKLLGSIPRNGLKGVKVAAFDTRAEIETVGSAVLTFFVKLFGYAAEPIAKQLQRKGGQLVAPPEGFFITDTEGPLKEGELERAARWASGLMTG
ncbi:MAG: flavodoxin family protein [Anaerolineae bacterium]|nr:flavodoxin family protein [Anaerolineae bacterium]